MQGTLDAPLDSAFYQGSGSTSLVPFPYAVALNGHPYLVDLEFKPWKRQAYRHTSVAMRRTQADTSNEPGEQSLNPDGLWRRTQDSWLDGAGQTYLDRKDSSEFRFRSSKGINPWTPWQLTLHFDTSRALTSANTDLRMAVAGSYLYVTDGQALKYTTDLASWTTVTGTPAANPSSICSDGYNVWVAYAGSGIYTTTAGAAAATQYVTTALTSSAVVRFVMGRLMVGNNNAIYNVIASGALPTALFTSNYSNFVWTDFAEGTSVIYASGNSGDKAVLYYIGITTDASALAQPIVAGRLPYGETVNCIYGYVGGLVCIGTSTGWRIAQQSTTAGDLDIGPVTLQTNGVSTFSGYNHFVWGNYTNYDTASTGLFRLDPTNFTDATVTDGVLVNTPLVAAWASDLMVTGQGAVTSVVHFNGNPVIAVSGLGVYKQAATYVASGTIDSGLITYGISDNKVPVFVDLSYQPLAGTITTYTAYNGGAFVAAGSANVASSTFTEIPITQTLSETIEIRELLTAGSSNTTTPTLNRHTLRSVPAAVTPTDIFMVIELRTEQLAGDVSYHTTPSNELDYLEGLRSTHQVCNFQEGNNTYSVTVESIDWIPEKVGINGEFDGVAVVNLRTVV